MVIAETAAESRPSAMSESARNKGGAAIAQWIQKLDLDEKQVAQGLGWFSIGLGLAEVAAPGLLAALMGTKKRPFLMTLFGVREITAGAGLLTSQDPAPWLWSRVVGDMMDLSALGVALLAQRKTRLRTLAATAAVAGVTALDLVCAQKASARPLRIQKAISINRSPEEAYRFWHQFEQYPRFMKRVSSVQPQGERRLHWVAQGPEGKPLEWDAEIVEDRPNELIQWRSADSSWLCHWGNVRFERAPGGRGTVVRVEMSWEPAGMLAAAAAGLLGKAPALQLQEDLRRMKQLIETGEIPTTTGQPSGGHPRQSVIHE